MKVDTQTGNTGRKEGIPHILNPVYTFLSNAAWIFPTKTHKLGAIWCLSVIVQ